MLVSRDYWELITLFIIFDSIAAFVYLRAPQDAFEALYSGHIEAQNIATSEEKNCLTVNSLFPSDFREKKDMVVCCYIRQKTVYLMYR